MEGYLRKQDHTALVKGWKKRYFRLAATPPATLYYYKEATSKDPIDGIALAGTKTYEHSLGDRKTEGLVFIVETKDRQYILAADSKPELQQWMSAIQRAMAPAPVPTTTVKSAIPVKQATRPPSARDAKPAAAPVKDEFADDMAKMMADLAQEEKSRGTAPTITQSAPAPTPSTSAPSGGLDPQAQRRANRAGSRMATDISKALADPNMLAAMEAEAAAALAANPIVPSASPRRAAGATMLGSRGKPPAMAAPPPPPPEEHQMPPASASGPQISPRKPSTDTAMIGERIGERKVSTPSSGPPQPDSLKTSQPMLGSRAAAPTTSSPAPAQAEPSLKSSQPLGSRAGAASTEDARAAAVAAVRAMNNAPAPADPRKVSIAPTTTQAVAAAASTPTSASAAAPMPVSPRGARGGTGDEGTAIISGRRRTAVAPPMEEPVSVSVSVPAPEPATKKEPSLSLAPKMATAPQVNATPATAASTGAAAPATQTAVAGGDRKVRGTFLAGNRRATVMEKPPLDEAAIAARLGAAASVIGGRESNRVEGQAENISPNLPMPVRRAARLQLGAQREEEDFFHLHKDDHGFYLLETPWQFRCFLRRLAEGGEGSDEQLVRVSLQGLLLERDQEDGLWMLNPSGYHILGPRSAEPFNGDAAECLFELDGGIVVRYNRGKWELIAAYVAESTTAHVVQEQQLPTITYKIRNYKSFPSEVKSHLSELDDAVDTINQHFEAAADPEQWNQLGDEEHTPQLGEIVRRRLAGALTYALSYGFNSSKGFFSGNNHLWHFIDAYLERTSFRQLLALGLVRTVRAVNATFAPEDYDNKLRAFLCSSLNAGLLHEYLQLLAANDEAAEKFFQASALMRVPGLLRELVESVEPLSVFTFKLKSGLKTSDENTAAVVEPEPLMPVEQLWDKIRADGEASDQATSANAEEVTPYEAPVPTATPGAPTPNGSEAALVSDKAIVAGRSGSPTSRVAAAGTSPQRGRPNSTSPQRERNNGPSSGVSPQRERPSPAGVSPQKERPGAPAPLVVSLKDRSPPPKERPGSDRQPMAFDLPSAPAPAAPPASGTDEGLLTSVGKSLNNWFWS